ncbi:uncharacterized protein LOC113291137 [Papaver somniferum]|uniref:uncharacterized protein LOC113291137 n=1 Tax=Papaver somniferum TaxID=3469 RepID=UPI000E6F84BD|nr:uncharacterized protein LOC113291137 [Papaver somniferum]
MSVPSPAKDSLDKLQKVVYPLYSLSSLSDQVACAHKNGFDANALYKHIFKVVQNNRMHPLMVVIEITEIVTEGLLKGNITEDEIEKLVPHGKQRIRGLNKKWGFYTIKNVREKESLRPATLTFCRMICLFPQIASLTLSRHGHSGYFANKFPNDAGIYPAQTFKLPMEMKHLGFGGLIPNGVSNALYNEILEVASLAFMVEFNLMGNPDRNENFSAAYEGQKPYMKAAKGGPITDTDRIAFLIMLGLDTVEAVTRIVEVANSAMVACAAQTRYSMTSFQPLIQGQKIKFVEDDTVYAHAVTEAVEIADSLIIKASSMLHFSVTVTVNNDNNSRVSVDDTIEDASS